MAWCVAQSENRVQLSEMSDSVLSASVCEYDSTAGYDLHDAYITLFMKFDKESFLKYRMFKPILSVL